jgi:lipopolysaccharide/colanic/teichoic acid biosynthesis glycosyltransferase
MVVDAEQLKATLEDRNSHDDSRTFKIPNDPRVTWIGRLMRRSSIDELPQLFNVLLGQMSLVGPRPPVPYEVAQYTRDDMRRLDVKPGLTCLWQISGRSRLPFPEQLRLDLQYVEERNLWLDFKVLLLTVPAVLSADGAY